MTRIVLHIDRLVLKGFDRADRHRIALDLQTELGHLLADPSAHAQLSTIGSVPSIRIANNNASPTSHPSLTSNASPTNNSESVGISAARSIAGGLLR